MSTIPYQGLEVVSTTVDRIHSLHCNKEEQAAIKEDMPHPNKVEQEVTKVDSLHHSKQEQGITNGDNLGIWVFIIFVIQIDLPLILMPNIKEVEMITGMIFGKLKDKKPVDRI